MALEDIDLPRQGTHGYTPAERLQAAIAWVVTGTGGGASVVCGIPARTIQDWTVQEWWPALVAEARAMKQEELDAKLTTIIDKCTAILSKRLDAAANDPDIERGVRGLAITAAVAIDKRALMRGEPTSRSERVTVEDRLANLSDRFKQMTNKAGKEGKADSKPTRH